MNEKKCPECNAVITAEEVVCHQCGYPLKENKQKKKRVTKTIVVVAICVFAVLIAVLSYIIIPLHQSRNAFEQAQTYEEAKDYESALENYSLVIPRDTKNYDIACTKISELTEAIKINKLVAKAFIALYNQNVATTLDSLSVITTDGSKVTCKISGIGYVISDTTGNVDEDYASTQADTTTGLNITEYESSYTYNYGIQTSFTNQIRQETSDIMFQTEQVGTSADNISTIQVQHYIDLYQEGKDLTVFN